MNLNQRLAADLDGAFADLVTEHQDLVFGVALRVVRQRADAEDVAQDAFVRAHRALRGYAPERRTELRLRPWLARIALNLARNHVRRARQVSLTADAPDAAGPRHQEPTSLVERREERRFWARLLAGLPDKYHLAVGLRHVDGLSYSELSEALGRPIGSAKSDVHRGVRLLRAAYEAELRRIEEREAV
jgi:RNA polymerase sigma-70 factor (ECF subfamily)